MSAESVLVATLEGDGAVTALVSTRIYPDAIPQEVSLPAIIYQRTASEIITTISSAAVGAITTFSVQCLAGDDDGGRTSAENVADAAAAALIAAGFVHVGRASGYSEEVDTSVVELTFQHNA